MKRNLYSCILIISSFAASLSAADNPALILDDGANRIGVTLVNRTSGDAHGVSISLDPAVLPTWLSVQVEPGAVAVMMGARAETRLFLVFTVKDAPADAGAAFPLVLRDASGKAWTYPLAIRTTASCPSPDALIGNSPNPFNPDTSVSFSLAESRMTRLVVYDTLGRKVRMLADGPFAAGKHTIRWDGKDDGGRLVSSGVYFCAMQSGTFVKTLKMTYMR